MKVRLPLAAAHSNHGSTLLGHLVAPLFTDGAFGDGAYIPMLK